MGPDRAKHGIQAHRWTQKHNHGGSSFCGLRRVCLPLLQLPHPTQRLHRTLARHGKCSGRSDECLRL